MPQILQTALVDNRAVDAAGETFQFDLAVNPLTAVIVTLRALNTAAAVAGHNLIRDFTDKYTNMNIKYRGATIIDGRSLDLLVLMAMRQRFFYAHGFDVNTNNTVRTLSFPILFGRKAYDPEECFPATRRGDLIMEVTAAADAGALDGHSIHVETVELLDAVPKRYVKVSETEQAMAGTGQNTIDLPIGNKLLGVLLNPFTIPTGADRTSSFGEINLEVDNVEVMYSGVDWEAAHAILSRRLPPWWPMLDHFHGFVDAAAGQTDTQLGETAFDYFANYGYLEMDPHDDSAFALDTRGAADVSIVVNSDVADGANLSRIYPVELVETGEGAASA